MQFYIFKKSLFIIPVTTIVSYVLFYQKFDELSGIYKTKFSNNLLIALAIFIIQIAVLLLILLGKNVKTLNVKNFLLSQRTFYFILFSIFIFFSIIGVKKYINIDTSLYDFGIQHQVIHNTSQGRWFESSVEVGNFLGDHTAYLMMIPALIYKIIPSPLVLFFIQSAAVVLGAYGIYLLSRKILNQETISKIFSIGFVFYIPLSANLLFDFHENSLGIPFLIFGIYYFTLKKYYLSYGLMFLSLLAKEDFGFFVGGFGLYHLLFRRNFMAIPLLGGFLYSLYAMFVLIPLYRAGELSDSFLRFTRFGTTGGEVISGILKDPIGAIKHMFSGYKVFYIFKLTYPLAFLSFIAPFSFVVFLPNLLINLLSDDGAYNSGLYHYNVLVSIGIFYSAILGMKNLQERNIFEPLRNLLNRFSGSFITLMLIFINTSIIIFHPVWKDVVKPLDRFDEYQYIQNFKRENLFYPFKIKNIRDVTPDNGITVGVANTLGSLFGEFRNLQIVYPENWGKYKYSPDFVFLDKEYGPNVDVVIQKYLQNGYEIVGEYKDVVILLLSSVK